jgi:hypothetical protein
MYGIESILCSVFWRAGLGNHMHYVEAKRITKAFQNVKISQGLYISVSVHELDTHHKLHSMTADDTDGGKRDNKNTVKDKQVYTYI